MDFVESCRQLIGLDTTPSQGTKEIGLFLRDYCAKKSLNVEIIEESWGGCEQSSIIIRHPSAPNNIKEFLLQTHLDTSDPGPFGLWKTTGNNPFDAHIVDGRIFGLGAADTKLDILCKIEALSAIGNKTNWKRAPIVVGTHSEELGMMGALKLIRKNKINADIALIGEPSNLKLITAGKGIATVEFTIPYQEDELAYKREHNLSESTTTQSRIFHGRAAHSSTPQLGESAIKKMFDYLLQLPEGLTVIEIDGGVNFNTVPANAFIELDLKTGHSDPVSRKLAKLYKTILDLEDHFLQYEDKRFTPRHPTLNIGLVKTFEDHIFISGTCRISPSVSNEVYEKWMQQLAQTCFDISASFKITDYKRPFTTQEESEFAQNCRDLLQKLDLNPETTTQSSTNEASLFSRTGIECICFGAGAREGNIHTPNEHVLISDLHKATEFYKQAIERFCL